MIPGRTVLGIDQHDGDGQYDRDCHNGDVVDQTDRGDDGVEREYDVEYGDLREHHAQPGDNRRPALFFGAFETVVNLVCRFGEKEQAAADQDDIASGNLLSEHSEPRIGEAHDP